MVMSTVAFFAGPTTDWKSWDYIQGDYHKGLCIGQSRYSHLLSLARMQPDLQVALRDSVNDAWTKWSSFYSWSDFNALFNAYEVHRSILENECVIESDYKTYEENYDASRIIGEILERKGFQPIYFYSGNKSIHIHVFIDFKCFLEIDSFLQQEILQKFTSRNKFVKEFMEWLRSRMVHCWDLKAREFDPMIKTTHLIRSVMSRNKLGYKTFIGYSHRDLSFIPYICNENNRIYPKLGEIRLSKPRCFQDLVEDFLSDKSARITKEKVIRRESSLMNWITPEVPGTIRSCVKFILGDEFHKQGDGFKRGMFILCNELKKVYGPEKAFSMVSEWNVRMGYPVKAEDIQYRIGMKQYSLSCAYIHAFLKSFGKDFGVFCKGKL